MLAVYGWQEEKRKRRSKMRKYLFVLLFLCLAGSGIAGEERLRMLWSDYKLTDEDTRPISIGAVLWENRELPDHLGLYSSVALFSYKDWRLECGGIGTWNEVRDRVEVAVLTGVSVRLWDRVVLGTWYAPFWNVYGVRPDDPWGIMVGYAFKTPQ
jgi:hypothetical protein